MNGQSATLRDAELQVDFNAVATPETRVAVVATELVLLAWLRRRFFHTSFTRSFLAITIGGAIIAALSAALGIAAGG